MKRIYWRPKQVSRTAIVGISLLALCGMAAVEAFPTARRLPCYETKLEAANLAQRSLEEIRRERLRLGHAIRPEFDPASSGLIGLDDSPVTSVAGNLQSKQTSINPNFAAAVVQMLHDAGVEEGDCVAVGCSGSFPALNAAVCAAIEALELKPVIIASATGSQFGANLPDLMWIDMERLLNERGLISFRSVAASLGGQEDRGAGMIDEGRMLVREAIRRNHLSLLEPKSFAAAIDERMRLYRDHSGGRPIRAYINVGGGAVSVGRSVGKHLYHPGLNVEPPPGATEIDSVMTRFMNQNVPVIHLVEVLTLARQFDFPVTPATTPPVGDGGVYVERSYNRWLVASVLLVLMGALRVTVLTDAGTRIMGSVKRKLGMRDAAQSETTAPADTAELMV